MPEYYLDLLHRPIPGQTHYFPDFHLFLLQHQLRNQKYVFKKNPILQFSTSVFTYNKLKIATSSLESPFLIFFCLLKRSKY